MRPKWEVKCRRICFELLRLFLIYNPLASVTVSGTRPSKRKSLSSVTAGPTATDNSFDLVFRAIWASTQLSHPISMRLLVQHGRARTVKLSVSNESVFILNIKPSVILTLYFAPLLYMLDKFCFEAASSFFLLLFSLQVTHFLGFNDELSWMQDTHDCNNPPESCHN